MNHTVPQLRPFQVTGVQKLLQHDRFILADDMGLGKTPQALSAIDASKFGALVVCPTSVKNSWEDECRRWRPDIKPIVCHGLGLASFKWPSPGELVIIGYNQLPNWLNPPPHKSGYPTTEKTPEAKRRRAELKRERKAFNKFIESQVHYAAQTIAIYDEAQALRDNQSARSRKCRILSAICSKVWVLSATPMPRGDALAFYNISWAAQMEETIFHNYPTFQRDAGAQYDSHGTFIGYKPGPAFNRAISKYMLRRSIDEICPELPGRQYEIKRVELNVSELTELPHAISQALRHAETAKELAAIRVLPEFKDFSRWRSRIARARIPAMLEHLDLLEENEGRSLVFSAHKAPILALAERPGWAVIHGEDGLGSDGRQQIVRDQEQYRGVAISIQSGGAGLNFPTFKRSLFVDLDWDFTANLQAERRNYRITSTGIEPRLYTILTSDTEMDRLVTHKMIAASFNCSVGVDGSVTAHENGFASELDEFLNEATENE